MEPDFIDSLISESLELERSGNIGAAFQRAQQALDLAGAQGSPAPVAEAQVCLARVHFRLGHYPEAQALASVALDLAGPSSTTLADALLLLGMCAGETSDITGSEAYFHRAIDLSRQLGYDKALLRGLHSLSAGVYMPRGQFELSLAADQEALRLAQDHGMPELAWGPLTTMSWVYWLTGRALQASETLDRLRTAAPPGSLAEGYYTCTLANLAVSEQQIGQALSLYARTRSTAETLGSAELKTVVRICLSRCYRAMGEPHSARAWAEDALNLAVRTGYCHLQGMSLIELARAAWDAGDLAGAEDNLLSALRVMTPLQTRFDLARAGLLLAGVLYQKTAAQNGDPLEQSKSAWIEAAQRIISGGYAFLLDQERTWVYPLIAAYLNDPAARAVSENLLGYLKQVPPPPLRICTLGKFEVWRGTQRLEGRVFRQRRADELLGVLLLHPGHWLPREQIIETLWPDQDPASVQIRFHHASSALRRALEPELPEKFPSRYLDVEDGQVALLLPSRSSIDFEEFENSVRLGEWSRAVELYRGDFLPELAAADWSIVPREALRQRYLRALLELARQLMDNRAYQDAISACRRILQLEPWQEQAVLLGMQACQAVNDRAGAFRLYRDLAAALEQDLGIKPQEEIQALYRKLTASGS